jgi:DHA1 family inner membrane transport protein
LALAVGGFAIGTTEFATMSLLPSMARDLQVDEPTAGHVISAYALGVVVGAPVIAILSARVARRTLLIYLMALFAVANGLSALAPDYHWMLLFRFVSGLPHGAYFGIACLVAAALVPVSQRTQAVGRVLLGLTIATIIGVPLANWLGQAFGWRWAFAVVTVLALVCALVLAAFGAGMTAGNLIIPRFADRALKRTAGALLVWAAVVLALYPLAAKNMATITLDVFAIGLGGALATVLQTRLMDVAGRAQALAAALNHSAFNVANALGPWLGGLAIAGGYGWTSTGFVGCALACGGLIVWGISVATDRPGEPGKL